MTEASALEDGGVGHVTGIPAEGLGLAPRVLPA
jgi:hypothetical protein